MTILRNLSIKATIISLASMLLLSLLICSTYSIVTMYQIGQQAENAIFWLIIISLTTFFSGTFATMIIVKRISNGLNKVISVSSRIASGDLSQDFAIYIDDEIGSMLHSIKTMQINLRTMVTELNDASSKLATSSEKLAVVTEQTNHAITQQSSEVHQVATAMNEMTATVQEVARNASDNSHAAHEANHEAFNGKNIVQETINAIEQLATGVEEAANVIQVLEQDSERIGTVLDVIKGIAEQTNLLALNAAIEAARAGEQGRGFAVVADEVRTLASRTQESTHEIEGMIESLQNGSRNAVTVMQSGREQAKNSVEKASAAGDALSNITNAVERISDINNQIATAAEEQFSVAEEMNRNIISINDISEQTVNGAKQTTYASEELASMATNLQNLISNFKAC